MEIESCPFCGGKAEVINRHLYALTYYQVHCPSCTAIIDRLTEDEQEAINMWNKRTYKEG